MSLLERNSRTEQEQQGNVMFGEERGQRDGEMESCQDSNGVCHNGITRISGLPIHRIARPIIRCRHALLLVSLLSYSPNHLDPMISRKSALRSQRTFRDHRSTTPEVTLTLAAKR